MPMPKSVTKINKNGVVFVSNVDRVSYTIKELSRRALSDAGKLLKRRFKENFYREFHKITGNAGKVTECKAVSQKGSNEVQLVIGLKTGRKAGFYAYFQEIGTKNIKKRGILKKTVIDNIPLIKKIESQYLSAIEEEERAMALIGEVGKES